MFIEADADVTLDYFGVDPLPPFPCFDEFLYDVTRLKCGGFIFAIRVNHTLCDGCGIGQFIKGIAEIAQGASNPSIIPAWCRELLCARDPPRVTFIHHKYKQLSLDDNKTVSLKLSQASFFFRPREIDALRCLLPRHLAQSSTTFDILTACVWRCHTAALQWQNPNQEVLLMCVVNARFKPCRFSPPLPEGFYGNAFVLPTAVSTVEKLCGQPLSYALELVKKTKKEASEEYVHSTADLMATKGKPAFSLSEGSFMVSDMTKCGFRDVDYGWGKPLYSGLDKAGMDDVPGLSYFIPYTNSKGEYGRVVLMCLAEEAMKRFEKELHVEYFRSRMKYHLYWMLDI
ncbi:hypothetical protein Ahy_A05g023907 [Arachis hypogaea]|uniref:Uncharacterized protein n=2 Tax=Arachis hypogaea TaxID=3818 RepID=A0A445D4W8_ARAHY|nr:hypothetical protein Ahy_A05g023907 [Arachis hypogaea]